MIEEAEFDTSFWILFIYWLLSINDKLQAITKVVMMAAIDSQVFEYYIYYCLVSFGVLY